MQKKAKKTMNSAEKIVAFCMSLIIAGYSPFCQAENLMQVYQQAIANDPSYKEAEANWLAAQQDLPIAKAALFPNLSGQFGGAYNNQNYTTDASFTANGDYFSSSLALNLTQPIFNWALWKSVEGADATVKAATATYYFAQQDLIARTVKAYLNVLQSVDILRFTRANKKAFAEEYDTAKQKFDVGLAPVTDVYDAQAKYDQSSAEEIANINTLNDSLEALHEITNHYYEILDGLGEKGIPLITPIPNNIDSWAQTSAQHNYQLQAQHYAVEAAKANIGVQFAGNLPSIGIQGTVSDQRQYQRTLTFTSPPETVELRQDLATIALVASVPIFSGGSVIAQTRQARYQYASASAQEEFVHRQVVGQTRQAFLGVLSNSAQVKADLQTINSAESALKSARAGYAVGTRTLLDVLDDTTTLYQSKENFALDQYAYMNNFTGLKESAGVLGTEDVQRLSSWLIHPIHLNEFKKISSSSKPTQSRQPTETANTTGSLTAAAATH